MLWMLWVFFGLLLIGRFVVFVFIFSGVFVFWLVWIIFNFDMNWFGCRNELDEFCCGLVVEVLIMMCFLMGEVEIRCGDGGLRFLMFIVRFMGLWCLVVVLGFIVDDDYCILGVVVFLFGVVVDCGLFMVFIVVILWEFGWIYFIVIVLILLIF